MYPQATSYFKPFNFNLEEYKEMKHLLGWHIALLGKIISYRMFKIGCALELERTWDDNQIVFNYDFRGHVPDNKDMISIKNSENNNTNSFTMINTVIWIGNDDA